MWRGSALSLAPMLLHRTHATTVNAMARKGGATMDTRRAVVRINQTQRVIAHAMDDEKQRERHYLDNPRQRTLARIGQSAATERSEGTPRRTNA
jgi:hypothetical protein